MREKSEYWWKNGTIYQIYPRSFYDASGDGVGDIPGIIEKLDYLEWLGVDGLWLSPVNVSPMFDFGYDISNYREIDPVFGTTDDYLRLIKEAHARSIRIIMDLVLNHTSHLHPWFMESRSSRDNPKRDWYIWHPGKKGQAPNNWKAAFGGSAWEFDEAAGEYYLHSFLKEQPDVNWRDRGARAALLDIVRYWLDQGVDGFRLDVVNWFIKDDQFRSNPFGLGPTPRPYDMQKHIYDRNRPETHEILKELRTLLNSYKGRMAVGEVYSPPPGDAPLSAAYLGEGDDELHLSFDFSLLFAKFSAENFIRILTRWYSLIPEKGWPALVLNNHDQPRYLTKIRKRDRTAAARLIALMLLTLKGTPFLYYGEELGMVNGKIKKKEIVDPVGKRYWPINSGRDPERTPMQWSAEEYAGFSREQPWLPVNDDFSRVNAESLRMEQGSILHIYHELIALRKEEAALNAGVIRFLSTPAGLMAYERSAGDEAITVMLNCTRREKKFIPVNGHLEGKRLYAVNSSSTDFTGRLAPFEAVIIKNVTFC